MRGRRLKTSGKSDYRPATAKVREALLSMLAARGAVFEGVRVLDLFAGTGSLGFESLSRGADLAVFVEEDRSLCRLLEENALALGLEAGRCRVAQTEVGRFLRQDRGPGYDLIFIDPPYGRGLLAPTMNAIMKMGRLAVGGLIAAEVEAGPSLTPPEFETLDMTADRTYGQTRICIWNRKAQA